MRMLWPLALIAACVTLSGCDPGGAKPGGITITQEIPPRKVTPDTVEVTAEPLRVTRLAARYAALGDLTLAFKWTPLSQPATGDTANALAAPDSIYALAALNSGSLRDSNWRAASAKTDTLILKSVKPASGSVSGFVCTQFIRTYKMWGRVKAESGCKPWTWTTPLTPPPPPPPISPDTIILSGIIIRPQRLDAAVMSPTCQALSVKFSNVAMRVPKPECTAPITLNGKTVTAPMVSQFCAFGRTTAGTIVMMVPTDTVIYCRSVYDTIPGHLGTYTPARFIDPLPARLRTVQVASTLSADQTRWIYTAHIPDWRSYRARALVPNEGVGIITRGLLE